MSIYSKNKTSVSSLDTVNVSNENEFSVGIAENAMNLVIDYLTNLYANPATAVVRELFTNASDANQNSDNPVMLSIEPVIAEGTENYYNFIVMDYGSGMSSEELKENYVTYANSSKRYDYDSVGAFGLGSKSPLAISPEYFVTSNNGKEQNDVHVYRTDNGLLASITESENKENYTFTKVTVPIKNRRVLDRMVDFIVTEILPFAKSDVYFNNGYYDIVDLDMSGIQVVTDAGKVAKIKFDSIQVDKYPITIYSNNIIDSVFAYAKARNINNNCYFKAFVRINDIIYPLFNSNTVESAYDNIVMIDVEPGFFPFAPSREALPSGDEINYIIDYFNKSIANFEAKDAFKILFEAGKINVKNIHDIILYEGMDFYNSAFSYLKEIDENDEYTKDIEAIFGDSIYDTVAVNVHTYQCSYLNNSPYPKRFTHNESEKNFLNIKYWIRSNLKSYHELAKRPYSMICELADPFKYESNNRLSGDIYSFSVVKNVKVNRKDEFVLPTPLRAQSFKTTMNESDFYLKSTYCGASTYHKVLIELKDDVIPEYIEELSKYSNVAYNKGEYSGITSICGYDVFDAKKIEEEFNKKKEDSAKKGKKQRYISMLVPSDSFRGCDVATLLLDKDSVKTFIDNNNIGYFMYSKVNPNNTHLNNRDIMYSLLVEEATGKKIAYINKFPKYAADFIKKELASEVEFIDNTSKLGKQFVVDGSCFNGDESNCIPKTVDLAKKVYERFHIPLTANFESIDSHLFYCTFYVNSSKLPESIWKAVDAKVFAKKVFGEANVFKNDAFEIPECFLKERIRCCYSIGSLISKYVKRGSGCYFAYFTTDKLHAFFNDSVISSCLNYDAIAKYLSRDIFNSCVKNTISNELVCHKVLTVFKSDFENNISELNDAKSEASSAIKKYIFEKVYGSDYGKVVPNTTQFAKVNKGVIKYIYLTDLDENDELDKLVIERVGNYLNDLKAAIAEDYKNFVG